MCALGSKATATNQTTVINFFGRAQSATKQTSKSPPTAAPPQTAAPPPQPNSPSIVIDDEPTIVLAKHERNRAMKRKAPEGPRGRSKAVKLTRETKVSSADRVLQFAGQGLKVSSGKVFCQACKEELTNIKEHIRRHLNSTKHKTKFEKFMNMVKEDSALSNDLSDFFSNNDEMKGVRHTARAHTHTHMCARKHTHLD